MSKTLQLAINTEFFFEIQQYELDLVFVKNSHEFVHEYLKRPEYVELMRRLGALGDGNQDQSKFPFLFNIMPVCSDCSLAVAVLFFAIIVACSFC